MRTLPRTFLLLSGAIVVLLIAGCHRDSNPPADEMSMGMAQQQSLYEKLGGEKAIRAVVDDFVPRVAGDQRVNFTRQGTAHPWDPKADDNLARLKESLVAFFTQATGGPQEYHGQSMKKAHHGMEIKESEWAAFVQDFKATLDHLNVPDNLQQQLLARIAPTHDQIVGQ